MRVKVVSATGKERCDAANTTGASETTWDWTQVVQVYWANGHGCVNECCAARSK